MYLGQINDGTIDFSIILGGIEQENNSSNVLGTGQLYISSYIGLSHQNHLKYAVNSCKHNWGTQNFNLILSPFDHLQNIFLGVLEANNPFISLELSHEIFASFPQMSLILPNLFHSFYK